MWIRVMLLDSGFHRMGQIGHAICPFFFVFALIEGL